VDESASAIAPGAGVRRAIGSLLALAILSISASATAQDYAREKRWADEVVPDLVVGDAVWLKQQNGHEFLGIYTAARNAKGAVLLVHGIGVNPNHGVIGVLRAALPDLGYSTLSIQMPVLAADAKVTDYYPKLFPDAIERIGLGAQWLEAKGYKRIVLLSHSLGSWMSEAYLEKRGAAPFAAWICLGRGGNFDRALEKLNLPVLDVYGADDHKAVLESAAERRSVLEHVPGSEQVVIPGADHFYTGREGALEAAIGRFLGRP
jgi:pimeloyl-ACP methyl ester carboxylesterase